MTDKLLNDYFEETPQWLIDSETAPTEVNEEVGSIVGGYVEALRKRGFSQRLMGIVLMKTFGSDLAEAEKRIDCILSCVDEGEEEKGRALCAKVCLERTEVFKSDTDPCEIIGFLKDTYGKQAAYETINTFPEILSCWKRADVRDEERYKEDKEKAEYILNEVASVFPLL